MIKLKEFDIKVNKKWCKRCGLCIDFCPTNVLEADEEGFPKAVNKEACIQCKLCEFRCPDFAIRIESREE